MNLAIGAAAVTLAVGVVTLIRYTVPPLYPVFKRIDQTHEFTLDMATNHLPHIYHAQEKICVALGVTLDEPQPVIRYTPTNE